MTEVSELADALGALREEIRALQARESALRDRLLAQPATAINGARYRVLIETKRQSRFDKGLLPQAIAEDPRYWRAEARTVVRAIPLDAPLRAEGAPPLPPRNAWQRPPEEDDDYEVIEHDHHQNRKYRCAMGSTSAGSQVSNTPSARTS